MGLASFEPWFALVLQFWNYGSAYVELVLELIGDGQHLGIIKINNSWVEDGDQIFFS